MTEEKRAHERVAARFPVEVKTSEGLVAKGRAENLGPLGVLVVTPDLEVPIAVGDVVEVTLWMPERESCVAPGEVLRADQEFAGGEVCRTFAIRFDDPIDP